MASLSDNFSLVGLLNDKDFIGLETYTNDECVLLSLKKRGVSVFKVRDQKPVYSWSLKQSQILTCPAVVNYVTTQLVTVINSQHVHVWNTDDSNLDKSKKIHMDQEIFKVVSVKGAEPVVIFRSGQLQFLSKIKESLLDDCKLEDKEDILWCDGAYVDNKLCVVVATNLKVQVVWLSTDSSQVCSHSSIQHREATLLSSCLLATSTHVHLYGIWSDRLLTRSILSPTNTTQTSDLCRLPPLSMSVAVTPCSPCHLAVCGIQQAEAGKDGLGIWDTKFGVLQTWTPLSTSVSEHKKIFCVGENLFIPLKTSVQVYPYTTQPSTLGAVLGSVKHPQLDTDSDSKQNQHTVGRELFKQLIDPTETPNKSKFKSVFNKFVNKAKTIEGQYLLESTYMSQLIDRCVNEQRFWPRDELEQLIQTRHVPSGSCKDLMNGLVSKKDLGLMLVMLKHVSDIPESLMVHGLSFLISAEDKECTKVIKGQGEEIHALEASDVEVKCPFSLEKCFLVNQVLVLPYNDVFLVESLRKLDFNVVLSFLTYLHYLLSSLSAVLTNHKTSTWPSLLIVVEWISHICDAHVTQLVLSPDAREVLLELHTIVMSQMQFYDELVSLEGIMSQLKEKCTPTQKQTPGLYNIHALHIR